MEKPDKKLIILASVAGALLIAVITLACVFFFAPSPTNALPESSEETSLEESSLPESSEELSSEEPSSEEESSSMPAFESQAPVSSKPPVVSSKPPAVTPKPPAVSSKPPAVSSKPVSSVSVPSAPVSSAPPANAIKLTQDTNYMDVTISPTASQKFYLDVGSDYSIFISVEDDNVKVSQSGREFTLTPNLSAMGYSRVGIECTSSTSSFTCELYLSVTMSDNGGSQMPDAGYWEGEIVDLVNQARAMMGLAPVSLSSTLSNGAATRATELPLSYNNATNGSHPRPDGSKFNTVYGDEANSYIYLENIARASSNASYEDIFYGWKNSSSHYNAMVDERMSTIGIGFWIGSDGRIYAAMHLSDRWE